MEKNPTSTTFSATENSGESSQPLLAYSPYGAPTTVAPESETALPHELEATVIEVLKSIYDPEIPVNIYELGLIYKVDITPQNVVTIRMTLTSPACPVAGSLPPEVETKIKSLAGVADCKVELVWDPPWDRSMMSEAAKLALNLF